MQNKFTLQEYQCKININLLYVLKYNYDKIVIYIYI